jgi:hypothetical protein
MFLPSPLKRERITGQPGHPAGASEAAILVSFHRWQGGAERPTKEFRKMFRTTIDSMKIPRNQYLVAILKVVQYVV